MKQLKEFINEKLHIGQYKKHNEKEPSYKDFKDFFYSKKNNFKKPLSNNVENYEDIKIGNCYVIPDSFSDIEKDLGYMFPFYILKNGFYSIVVTFKEEDNIEKNVNDKKNKCSLEYRSCNIRYGELHSVSCLGNVLEKFGEDIDFQKIMDIINELFDITLNTDYKNSINKFNKVIDKYK